MTKKPDEAHELDPQMQRDMDCFNRGYSSGFSEGELVTEQNSFIEILILVQLLEKVICYQNSDQQIKGDEIFIELKKKLKTKY